jgi:hypothetical protein
MMKVMRERKKPVPQTSSEDRFGFRGGSEKGFALLILCLDGEPIRIRQSLSFISQCNQRVYLGRPSRR